MESSTVGYPFGGFGPPPFGFGGFGPPPPFGFGGFGGFGGDGDFGVVVPFACMCLSSQQAANASNF
jgi:hypothetical protein